MLVLINSLLVCEVHDCCKLLYLCCIECVLHLSTSCVTCKHIGHKVKKASKEVETQLQNLESSYVLRNYLIITKAYKTTLYLGS